MAKLNDIETISQNLEEGAWIGGSELPNMPLDVHLKVRGVGNSSWRRLNAELRKGQSVEDLNDEKSEEQIETRLLHETVLVDWKGIDDLPFSKENSLKILTDSKTVAFRTAVVYASHVVARRGKASLEADAKN